MHSPFIYELIREVLNDRTPYPEYRRVEQLKARLKKDTRLLNVEDMGAGSVHAASHTRTVGSIARQAAKPKKWGQLLFRLARYYQPAQMVELGTSLGMSSAYLQLGHPAGKLTTLEGAASIAAVARKNFAELGLSKIKQVEGNFDDTLASALEEIGRVDMAFVDGNHRLEPTLRYFEQLKPVLTPDSILIFDDIHWSAEMEQAWNQIVGDQTVTTSVDLFFVGLVFFRKEFREKQHFQIRF